MINELVDSKEPPEWLTKDYCGFLQTFSEKLFDRLYPGLNEAIDKITDENNFKLIANSI